MICPCWVLSTAVIIASLHPLGNGAMAGQGQKPLTLASIGEKDFNARSPFTQDFDVVANDILQQWKVPGMSIAVVDGHDVFAKGFGIATLPDTPSTPETLFYVGSTTKAQTAALMAQLIDSKAYPALSRGWSTPISSILRDDFLLQDEWATSHITLDDAASHRTGMAAHDNSWHREINGSKASLQDIVRGLRNLPLSAEPRTTWYYCNLMYITLSYIIEVLTQRRLKDVMTEFIWEPLGMKSTYLSLQDAKDSSLPLAVSYTWCQKDQSYKELPYLDPEHMSGAGGIISNVIDYAKWLKCLIHQTKPFSQAVHQDIRTPRFIDSARPTLGSDVDLYGLAWQRTIIHGRVVYWHYGSTITFGALVYWLPDLKFGIVALANGAETSNQAELVLVRRLLDDKLRIPFHDRLDVNQILKEQARDMQCDMQKADDILFPERPKTPYPPSVNLGELTGFYSNLGYGRFNLVQQQLSANSDQTVLVADRTELLWAQQWRLRHVSGNYWTLYSKMLLGINTVTRFYAAEFKIGVSGKVTGLEVSMYDRYGGVDEGTVLFHKVGGNTDS